MQYSEFIDRVTERTGLEEREAKRLVQATFETLSDRLAGGAPSNLGSELPEPVKSYLSEEGKGEIFDIAEFERRVASRAKIGTDTALEQAGAVIGTVREAVDATVVDRVVDQLPDDYAAIFSAEEIAPSGGE